LPPLRRKKLGRTVPGGHARGEKWQKGGEKRLKRTNKENRKSSGGTPRNLRLKGKHFQNAEGKPSPFFRKKGKGGERGGKGIKVVKKKKIQQGNRKQEKENAD